jgi:hypothetical protein
VDDAAPGGHQVRVTWNDRLDAPEAVAMNDVPLEEVRQRAEPDVRVGRDVESVAGRKSDRAHVIEKHEGADVAPLLHRERARDRDVPDRTRAPDDDRQRLH